jgi:hypothetical protein
MYECVMGFTEANATGCILADEMGLGKTLQTIALIHMLLSQSLSFHFRRALTVMQSNRLMMGLRSECQSADHFSSVTLTSMQYRQSSNCMPRIACAELEEGIQEVVRSMTMCGSLSAESCIRVRPNEVSVVAADGVDSQITAFVSEMHKVHC